MDIRRIRPSREADADTVENGTPRGKDGRNGRAAPSHPSRIWVQIATGRDKAALAFDWRRFLREDAEVLRGKQPSVSAWGQTNRLLTGPFPSEAAANSFIGQLRRAGFNGAFLWNSPAGQVVDALPTK